MVFRLTGAIVAGVLLALAGPFSLPAIIEQLLPMALRPQGGYWQLPWLAFCALVPLYLVIQHCHSRRQAFGWAYTSGAVWLVLHLLWLNSFGWAPVILLALWFALPTGIWGLALFHFMRTGRPGLVLWGAPAVWAAVEYLRTFGFWSFPWNLLGYTQAMHPRWLQTADLGGVFLVSFLLVLANGVLWLLLFSGIRLRLRLGLACIASAVLLGTLAYGEWRLSSPELLERQPVPAERNGPEAYTAAGYPLTVALVQGGIGTRDEHTDSKLEQALAAYMPPSNRALEFWASRLDARQQHTKGQTGPFDHGALLIVWPESVLPRAMSARHRERVPAQVHNLLSGSADAALLLGAFGRAQNDEEFENGAMLVRPPADMEWVYSKVRLIAYGEVVPLGDVVRFFANPWGNVDPVSGRSMEPAAWRGHRLGVQVCFDNVFAFVSRQQARAGAGMLVLITNNSWYQLASGIRQHCDMDILRAVECRRPVVRVSTTGWSHVAGADGKIAPGLETGQPGAGFILADVPEIKAETVYTLVGDVFAQLCVILSLLAGGWAMLSTPHEGML